MMSIRYPLLLSAALAIIAYFYYLILVFAIRLEFLLAGISLLIIVSSLYYLSRKSRPMLHSGTRDQGMLSVLIVGLLILTFRFTLLVRRWGDWDAWAIWNLHAKFLASPQSWTNLFTTEMERTHPDYPMMLPSLIALIWRGLGQSTPLVPIIFSNLILILTVSAVFMALTKFNGPKSAVCSILIFVLDSKFIGISALQYADTLLALFILITFVTYTEMRKNDNKCNVVLLGFLAGSAAWIKNEGQLFFLIFTVYHAIFQGTKYRNTLLYLAGSLLPMIVLLHFKVYLAPANDLVNPETLMHTVTYFLHFDRHLLILKHFLLTALKSYWIIVPLLAINLLNKRHFLRISYFPVICLQLVGYYLIFVITPNDLNWHLSSSLDRLMHHIYPAGVYLLLLELNPEFWGKFEGKNEPKMKLL